jgi:hypothetical protein
MRLFVAALSLGLASGISACSTSAATSTTSDAASDAPLDSDAATDPVCQTIAQLYTRCAYDQPCDQTNLRNCPANAAIYSDSYRAAILACAPTSTCDRDAGANSDCYATALGASRSDALRKLALDYCAKCSTDAGGCESDFYVIRTDGGASGVGASLLLFSDPVVVAVDRSCTGAALDNRGSMGCPQAFAECVGSGVLVSQGYKGRCVQ